MRERYQRFYVTRPPSVNDLYATHTGKDLKYGKTGTRRVKTEAYKRWLDNNGRTLALSPIYRVEDRVGVRYSIPALDRRKRDIGNLEKALSDLLSFARLIDDDCYLDHIEIVRIEIDEDDCDASQVMIEIWPMPERKMF